MLADDQEDVAEPMGIVPARASHSDWTKPELRFSAVPLNVDMRSLQAVGSDDAEPEAALDQPCGHRPSMGLIASPQLWRA